MNKLIESVPSTNVKIIELYNKIDSGSLITDPDFQRKLVWKKQHKYHFIETILFNYPFPEVYIASSEINVQSLKTIEVVVDGQQRLTTIVDYIKGIKDFANQTRITQFEQLTDPEKKSFLNYFVSVRDLKDINKEIIKNIFMRINSTEYSLNAVEKTNAQYGDGEFIMFCKQIVESDFNPTSEETDSVIEPQTKNILNTFFNNNVIFTENDKSRMMDMQYIMTLIASILEPEYFSRNSKTVAYTEEFNEVFPDSINIAQNLESVLTAINKLMLPHGSYWFNKPNLFTLIIEFYKYDLTLIDYNKLSNELNKIDLNSKKYFANIELETFEEDHKKYFEFAKEGINEKAARIHRAKVLITLIENSLLQN
jgi:uncharacterized protein with ParB-like and HNH nuclease domain